MVPHHSGTRLLLHAPVPSLGSEKDRHSKMPAKKKLKSSPAKNRTRTKTIQKKIFPLNKSKTNRRTPATAKNSPTIFDPWAIEKYLSITDNIVVALDSRGKVTFINKAGCKLLGYKKNEVIGKIWSDHFIPASEKKRNQTLFKNYRSGQLDPTGHHESQILTRKGKELVVAWDTVLTKDINGKMTGVFYFGRDLTEHIQTEKALGRSERQEVEKELKKYQEQLMHAEKLSLIGKLSASIAHEVNNPLFGIRNVLERTKLVVDMKPEDMNFIDMAIGETDRIANLIKRLNDFYRPTTGKMECLKIHQILDEIILLTRKELLKRNIKLETQFDDGLPMVTAVSDQIKQVMLNLIQNAMDASKKSGGRINIKTSHGNSLVKIQVQDNGIGMTPEITEQIFNPFFTTKSKVLGTGLGLSVSYGIIESHGGTIVVASTPGKGSSFTVSLPIKKP